MPDLVGTSSKLIVLLMVQTSSIAIAQNTLRDVMLKERAQINNVQNGSDIEGCYEMKVSEIRRSKVLTKAKIKVHDIATLS